VYLSPTAQLKCNYHLKVNKVLILNKKKAKRYPMSNGNTFAVRVNSKYKQQGETNSKFSYDLVSSQACASVTSVSLIQFSLNRLFTNIYSGNNVLHFRYSGNDTYFVAARPGQYTVEELCAEMTLQLTNVQIIPLVPVNFIWTFNPTTNLISVGTNVVTTGLNLIFEGSTLGPFIGMTSDVLNIDVSSNPDYMQTFPQLQGPDQIYVESSNLASGQCLDDPTQTGGSIPLLGVIPCGDVPYGYTVNHMVSEMSQRTVFTSNGQPGQLKRINIELTDKFGVLLNIPDTCYADLLFRVTYTGN
jgi:hypothetical protein